MTLKELDIKLTMDITGNEERAIDNLITDIKNHFIGHCWSEQYYSRGARRSRKPKGFSVG